MALPKITLTATRDAIEGGANGIFTITLDKPAPAGGLAVYYDTQGKAIVGSDYSVLAGTQISALMANSFLIKAGANSATLTVVAATDTVKDDKESVELKLSIGNTLDFTAQKAFSVAGLPETVRVADFNNDGNADVATVNNENTVSVLLGNGQGNFNKTSDDSSISGAVIKSIASSDFNNDGNADLVTANLNSNDVSVLLGDGSGNFISQSRFAVGVMPLFVNVGDVNNDDNADLLTANVQDNTLSVLLGDGHGNFATQTTFKTIDNPSAVGMADFNHDGNADLVTVNTLNTGRGYLSVFLGNGQGDFKTHGAVAVGDLPLSIGVGDFNNDGNADLTTANIDNKVSVLLGNGQGGFAKQNTFAVGKSSLDSHVSDFNGDGNADIVVANEASNSVSVLLGDGRGGFAVQRIFATGKDPAISIGDFNNDGKTDIVTANGSDKNVSVLINATEKAQEAAQTITGAMLINESTKPLNLYGDIGGAKADVLFGTTGADKLHGLTLTDKLSGSAGNDSLWGGLGNDSVLGDAGDDVLYGGQGNDSLKGNAGNDLLVGGIGNDTVAGGVGKDIFKFDAALEANIDRIIDFNVADDSIQLDRRIFSQLARKGTLADSAFHIGTKAVDSDDRIIYNKNTGALTYDDDGTGSHTATQIAVLGVKLALTAADFLIV